MKFRLLSLAVLFLLGAPAAFAAPLLYATVYNPYSDEPPGNILKIETDGSASVWDINWDADIALFDPQGLAFDSVGNLFVNDGAAIYKIDAAGNGTTFAMKPSEYYAGGLAIDAANNVYSVGADGLNYAIYRYDSAGNQTAVWTATGGSYNGLALGPDGALYATDVFGDSVVRIDSTTGEVSLYAEVPAAWDLTFDAAGNLYVIGGPDLDQVFKVSLGGGSVTPYVNAGLGQASGLAFDNITGSLYMGDRSCGCTDDNSIFLKTALPVPGEAVLFSELTSDREFETVRFLAMAPTPVPEPATVGAAFAAMLLVLVVLRRHRQDSRV